MINLDITGNLEEFYTINERAGGLVTKLNKKYKLKVVQAYAPTSSHGDELVESFYEDVESALRKVEREAEEQKGKEVN